MIADQEFLGLKMERRHDRRVFVLGFCAFMCAFLFLGLWWTRGLLFGNLAATVILAGSLGGIRGGGPVKRFNGRDTPADPTVTDAEFPVQTLNLQNQLAPADGAVHLDERETTERDRAHFLAFRVLRWSAAPLCILLGTGAMLNPKVAMTYVPAFLWLLLITILSLPQLVLLWTEPDGLD